MDSLKPLLFKYNYDCLCSETDEELNPMSVFYSREDRERCWRNHLCDLSVLDSFKTMNGKLYIGSFLWCPNNKVLRFAAVDTEADDLFTDKSERNDEIKHGCDINTPWSEYINLSTTYLCREFRPLYFSEDFPAESDWVCTLYAPGYILEIIKELVDKKGKHKLIYMHKNKVNNSYMCKLIPVESRFA